MWDLIFNRNKKHLPNYFSFSQISSFEMCPMQYKLIYIDGVKRKYESIESFMGKRVHSVLEWLYKPENKEKIIVVDLRISMCIKKRARLTLGGYSYLPEKMYDWEPYYEIDRRLLPKTVS